MTTIKILESSRGKVPSCYVNKTFEVKQVSFSGHIDVGCDKWVGKTSTGKEIAFSRYGWSPDKLFVTREGFARGTWCYNFEITEA